MSESIEDLPFAQVLDQIFGNEQVPIYLLYRLSDISGADSESFQIRWPEAPRERRRVITRYLADLTEEDFTVAFEPVFRYCLDDSYGPVRQAAIEGLWDSTHVGLIRPILYVLESDPDQDVRAAAASTLAHYLILAAWGQLPDEIEPPIVAALLESYRSPDSSLGLRRAALESLGAINSDEVSALIEEAYESGEKLLQISALCAMGNSADRRWNLALWDELDNPDSAVRFEAARAIGLIGSSESVGHIADAVYDDDDEVALAAVDALASIGGMEANDVLDEAFSDRDLKHLHAAIEDALMESLALGAAGGVLSADPFSGLFDEEE